MTRTRLRVNLRIEDLVIDGFTPGESRAIAIALERELGRALAGGAVPFEGGPRQSRAFDRLDAGVVTHPKGTSPGAIGRSAAHAILRRLQVASTGNANPRPHRGGA